MWAGSDIQVEQGSMPEVFCQNCNTAVHLRYKGDEVIGPTCGERVKYETAQYDNAIRWDDD